MFEDFGEIFEDLNNVRRTFSLLTFVRITSRFQIEATVASKQPPSQLHEVLRHPVLGSAVVVSAKRK